MTEQIVTPTAATVRDLFHYDPETGIFRWRVDRMGGKKRNGICVKAGAIAGCKTAKGYWQLKIGDRAYRAHRVAWLYMNGEWPDGPLDHERDGPLCNKFSNLRLCNGTQNNANRIKVKNRSGYKGVYKNGKWGTWVARIGGNCNREFLGCYADPRSAALAYDAAAVRMFGEFARTNKMLGLLP